MWRTYALANPYEMGRWHSASVSKLIVASVSLEKYFISGGLLYILNHRYGAVLCVPDVYDESGVNHRKRIFDEMHGPDYRGKTATLNAIRERFWWPNSTVDVTSMHPC